MFLTFLKTKIGMSAAIAVILIAAAIGIKALSNRQEPASALRQKVGLIADSSVKENFAKGATNWEDSLKLLKETTPTSTASSGRAASSTPKETTATDRFAREIFTLYAQAKQGGKTIDENTVNDIAESVLSKDYTGISPLATIDDIHTTTDTSRTRAKAYGNAVGSALSVKRPDADQDLFILERLMNGSGTEKDRSDLGLILNRYKSITTTLKGITVPQDAATSHLDLINGMNYLATAVEGMLTLDTDPIGSLTKIKVYQDGIDTLTAGDLGLRNYFASKNVTFSSDEAGYRFK